MEVGQGYAWSLWLSVNLLALMSGDPGDLLYIALGYACGGIMYVAIKGEK